MSQNDLYKKLKGQKTYLTLTPSLEREDTEHKVV